MAKKAKKVEKKEKAGVTVANSSFAVNVNTADAVTKIAEGLILNAKALGELAGVMNASHVRVESLLTIGPEVEEVAGK